MIAPLIISIITALLSCGCLGVFVWQIGQVLSGDVTWVEAAYPLILSQLGILFFGIFAIVAWKNYRDESTDSKAVVGMVLIFFLEVALLLGIKCGLDVHDRVILMEKGIETSATIIRHKRSGSGRHRHSTPIYQFTALNGQKIEDSIEFQMSLELPLGEYSRFKVSSDAITYRIGSSVPVLYLPENPECHVVLTFGELWCVPLGTGAMSLVIFGVMGYQIYSMRKRRAGRSRRRFRRRW